jgi:putative PIN family toxin of toxin-antitoxin system
VNDARAPAVVLDTNVVLDWLVFHDSRVQPLADALQARRLRWLACPAMRDELGHMLAHPSLARWQPDREQALTVFDTTAWLCLPPARSRLLCTDADDQVFIDLALAEKAQWLLTHDRALLKLARRARTHGVRVATPDAWWAVTSTGQT